MEPEMMPFRDWCKASGFGLTTGYKLVKAKKIKIVKLGKLSMITREESKRFAQSLPEYQINETTEA